MSICLTRLERQRTSINRPLSSFVHVSLGLQLASHFSHSLQVSQSENLKILKLFTIIRNKRSKHKCHVWALISSLYENVRLV
jgi:hypothetical protein